MATKHRYGDLRQASLIDDDDRRRPFGCQRRKPSGISVFSVGLWLLLSRGLESLIGRYKEAEPTDSVDWSRACRLTEPYRDVEAMLCDSSCESEQLFRS